MPVVSEKALPGRWGAGTNVIELNDRPADFQPHWRVMATTACSIVVVAILFACLVRFWGPSVAATAAGLTAPLVIIGGIFSRPTNPVLILCIGLIAPIIAISTSLTLSDVTVTLAPFGAPSVSDEANVQFAMHFGRPTLAEWAGLVALQLVSLAALTFARRFSDRTSRTLNGEAEGDSR